MDSLNVHELTAAYALDALDPDDAATYEAHLANCESCRDELASFGQTAAALAWAVDAPAPPPRLRAAILDAAAAERPNVVPLLRKSWAFRSTAAVAAVAACAAVGFGIWSATLHARLGNHRDVSAAVVVDAAGRATLTVSGLPAAPSGKTYEVWVIPAGGTAQRAGLFHGGTRSVIHLQRPVPNGAVVAATVERSGGANAPTTQPVLTAQT